MDDAPIVIVSNRGPVSFRYDDEGTPIARRGGGGLVSGLAPLVVDRDTLWIAAAMSDADVEAAGAGPTRAERCLIHLLPIPPDVFGPSYDVVANATLWFLHHSLWDLARRPRFDRRWHEAWAAFGTYHDLFAEAVVTHAPPGSTVLVQDYHLSLLAPRIRARRDDLTLVHFHHTPFATPEGLGVLPDGPAAELMMAMGAYDACGFHTERWADAYRACSRVHGRPDPTTFVAPLGPDPADISSVAATDACAQHLDALEAELGSSKLIVRVDRIELSKNLLRGFSAFDDLLERYPQWRERVTFAALVYPSREGLAEYLSYRQEVEGLIAQINARWATETWTPLLYDPSDDFPRSVAALRRYDVLLVNPIRDGLNLVAQEGPLVNERDGVVCLSPDAGSFARLEGLVERVHAFDITATADALHRSLSMSDDERRAKAAALRAKVRERGPADWLADLVAAAPTR